MRTISYNRRRYFFGPLILVAIAVFSLITMLLWNALMPAIFNLPVINYWQAAGLLILARLLFGIGRHYSGWPHYNPRYYLHDKILKMSPEERKEWRHHLHEKVSNMSPAERRDFFSKMHNDREAWEKEYGSDKEPDSDNGKPE